MSEEKIAIDSGAIELLLGIACLLGAILEMIWFFRK